MSMDPVTQWKWEIPPTPFCKRVYRPGTESIRIIGLYKLKICNILRIMYVWMYAVMVSSRNESIFIVCAFVWGAVRFKCNFIHINNIYAQKYIFNLKNIYSISKIYIQSQKHIFMFKKYIFMFKKYIFNLKNIYLCSKIYIWSQKYIFMFKNIYLISKIYIWSQNYIFNFKNICSISKIYIQSQKYIFNLKNIYLCSKNIYLCSNIHIFRLKNIYLCSNIHIFMLKYIYIYVHKIYIYVQKYIFIFKKKYIYVQTNIFRFIFIYIWSQKFIYSLKNLYMISNKGWLKIATPLLGIIKFSCRGIAIFSNPEISPAPPSASLLVRSQIAENHYVRRPLAGVLLSGWLKIAIPRLC